MPRQALPLSIHIRLNMINLLGGQVPIPPLRFKIAFHRLGLAFRVQGVMNTVFHFEQREDAGFHRQPGGFDRGIVGDAPARQAGYQDNDHLGSTDRLGFFYLGRHIVEMRRAGRGDQRYTVSRQNFDQILLSRRLARRGAARHGGQWRR